LEINGRQAHVIKGLEVKIEGLEATNARQARTNERLEAKVEGLEATNTRQARTIEGLEANIKGLEGTIEELQGTAQMTNLAFAGVRASGFFHSYTYKFPLQDRAAINDIRNRVLLDMGRNILARICHYNSWIDWKSSFPSLDDLSRSAHEYLTTSEHVSADWIAVANRPSALRLLLKPNPVRYRGDMVAHSSTRELIGESVLALRPGWERGDMTVIFRGCSE
jgi:uncharacterized coiled-coil protein SlyX